MSDDFYQVADFIFNVKKGLLYSEDDVWAKIKNCRPIQCYRLPSKTGRCYICRTPKRKHCKTRRVISKQ
jgi:hypothetical protein